MQNAALTDPPTDVQNKLPELSAQAHRRLRVITRVRQAECHGGDDFIVTLTRHSAVSLPTQRR